MAVRALDVSLRNDHVRESEDIMEIPGFVDLQVNGYLGVGFTDPKLDQERCADVCRKLLRNGTAAFLPTVITAPMATFERNLPLIAELMDEDEFRDRLIGFHLEGPFLSSQPGAIGAHRPECTLPPDPRLLDRMQEAARGRVKLITVAAEVPGVDVLIRHAVSLGITVSLGHQLADADALARAADAGATGLTHLGNGVPNMLPRHPNPLWDGLAEDRLHGMFISDGHHIAPHVLRTMIRAKGLERSVIVSDASSYSGMPPGEYHGLDNRIVLEESGRLHNPNKGCLVGSAYTMRECMNVLHRMGYDLPTILKLGVEHPLRLIGMAGFRLRPVAPVVFDPAAGFEVGATVG